MLRSSWDVVVNATASRPDLVPLDSLAARISDRLWGYSPWMIWLTPEEPEVVDVSPAVNLSALGNIALKVNQVATEKSTLQKAAEQARLTVIEEDLLSYIFDVVRPDTPSDTMLKLLSTPQSHFIRRQPGPDDERLLPETVVKSLGVPSSVISAALGGIASKLDLNSGT